ncbi:DUF2235 domain-containing protein [Amaricoccus solimangrovi]|uniref:DUF2235 domain-containing protein n=1 Tax=Amaricoccus solimangrovi TaxID=2589815 RepID=A0A501X0X8_9RHOB|nr:DUF2235 domain-containing protein [Amaricoccus solimangrovi]TPE53761.1 DUF2235 domain-containing protein [Amaricoccus solimangrovi]
MKRIVVCCDGTWNRLDSEEHTNVGRLAAAILGTATGADGTRVTQIVHHLDGVGSGRGTGRASQTVDRLFGGAFGWGLDALITEAYRFLALNYEPGDEIYVFGFSRGAYCARSLCGLIGRAGIVERRHADRIDDATRLYRDPAKGSASEAARVFRARYASHVTTIDGEAAWREREGLGDHPDPVRLRLAYLGVWDTVGSLGVPRGLFGMMPGGGRAVRRHSFHDTKLSPLVAAARHAVAIDERRWDFEPTLWQLDDILGKPGLDPGDYPQQWFPGVHGAVGGGGPDAGLSSAALLWVLEGAEARGLRVDGGMRKAWVREAAFDGPLDAGRTGRSLADRVFRLRSRDRTAVPGFDNVSETARRRWKGVAAYRPNPLAALRDRLDGWDAGVPEGEATPPRPGEPPLAAE